MSTDIHSYFEVRASRDAAWELLHKPVVDEEGRLDVPYQQRPFGIDRSSLFLVVLTGIISARVDVDYARLQPLVPEDRALAEVSAELVPVLVGWHGSNIGVYWLTLEDLERVDWDAQVPMTDASRMSWEDAAPHARAALDRLREIAAGRDPQDVRIVFWFDW